MPVSDKPPKTLKARESAAAMIAPKRPSALAPFASTPEARRVLEEMRFNDRFADEFAHQTVMVGVNEVAAVNAGNNLPCIGTTSLRTCLGLAAYDMEKRVGAVAHVLLKGANPAFESVSKMLDRLIEAARVVGGKRFTLYTFNGRSGNRTWNGQLGEFLERAAGALKEAGIISSFEHRDEHNFVLDARSGEFFTAKPE